MSFQPLRIDQEGFPENVLSPSARRIGKIPGLSATRREGADMTLSAKREKMIRCKSFVQNKTVPNYNDPILRPNSRSETCQGFEPSL